MYYHGTEFERGKAILQSKKMGYSRSTERKQHWLGDGIYLYRDKLYAFRWIVLMYRQYCKDNGITDDNIKEELYAKYMILKLDIDYNSDRAFRFNNPEHLEAFLKVKEEYKNKSANSKKISNTEYADGIILNIMFKKMDYKDNYDLVEATFPLINIDNIRCHDSRIKSINEDQICIKNPNLVKNIENITDTIDIDSFYEKFKNFEKFKSQLINSSKLNDNSYSSKTNRYSSKRSAYTYRRSE